MMPTLLFVAATASDNIWQLLKPLGITNVDPFLLTIISGLVWPWVQAALDKPWWTPARRFALACAAAVLLSLVIWYAGHYPISWRQIVTQAMMILGILTAAFRILKALGVIDWVGKITPGGEPYEPKH